MSDRQVDVHVRKATADYWPRVLAEAARKPAWLKIDFDKLQTEDDDDDSEEDNSLRNFYVRRPAALR